MIIKSDEQYWQYVRLVDDMLDIMGENEDHYLVEALNMVSVAIVQYDEAKELTIKRRVKGGSKTSSFDIQQAAEAGDKVFQYYCEHGKLPEGVVR